MVHCHLLFVICVHIKEQNRFVEEVEERINMRIERHG